ncbi:hypothetical protein JOF53_000359 [Crossiella equi]|uniref:Uncharacterized protein n=1 Tax=Crossiella equi TaxID=130796 RepID=A0ABS5A4I7_9PSEU|nr:hypothetical protein [Crossiella equi]MBP2471487.1 hypothetical protein [Crossiella equi]
MLVEAWTEVVPDTTSESGPPSYWYLPADGPALGVHTNDGELVTTLRPHHPALLGHPVLGAPVSHRGHLDVPVPGAGIWRLRPDGTDQDWLPATGLPEADLFAWCGTQLGLLFTSTSAHPRVLRAYDPATLTHLSFWDIDLGPAPVPLTHVCGGVFTPNQRLVLVSGKPSAGVPNTIACFDLVPNPRHHRHPLHARCGGARSLPEVTGDIAGVAIRPAWIGDTYAPLHVLSASGFPPHSFSVPEDL